MGLFTNIVKTQVELTNKNTMITRKNKSNRTAFVYDSYAGVEAFVSKSFRGANQRNQLTLRDGDTRIDLNGRQINTLRRVLNTATRLAA